MNRTVAGLEGVRIRSVDREELQCDLCEWKWLVPEWAVALVAKLHWDKNHPGDEAQDAARQPSSDSETTP